MPELGWTIESWRQSQLSEPFERQLLQWVAAFDPQDPAFICVASAEQVRQQLAALRARLAAGGTTLALPLLGVPLAVKDNIDVQGFPTTAACPAYSYPAQRDAETVARLRKAGAIVVAKTNMDQFATGLVGTRSPYGAVPSAFNPEYIGGGSSSGSASAVARGLVPFALGTDTAGSGRVPAGFQNIVGWKPTRGAWSTRGVVPACRTLDCVSVFALTVDDALQAASLLQAFDAEDPYSRPWPAVPSAPTTAGRVGVPSALEFFGDDQARRAFAATVEAVARLGYEITAVDFSPFSAMAELLYASPWVVERYLVAQDLVDAGPHTMDETVHGILARARDDSAMAAFQAEYRRADLARQIAQQLASVEALLVPTTPTCYRVSEVAADPLGTNGRLGTYTNFTNLADLCGLAVPGCFREDGLPAGVTLLAPAFQELRLAKLGRALQQALSLPLGATGAACPKSDPPAGPAPGYVRLAVVGAHLRGMALNHQLTERQALFAESTRTSSHYKLFALANTTPRKPGLERVASGGKPIEVELWDMPMARLGEFVAEIPGPLGMGKLELEDGRWVSGFICEGWALADAEDITEFGGFKAYLRSKSAP